MNERQWTANEARRESTPLLVGVFGPSGSGKTFSALRIAKGIQETVGGEVYGVDTENRRMLHYADRFRFKHVPFSAPFASAAYMDCLTWCVKDGAKTLVVDSMSHEHAGEGGYLDFHEQEVNRLAGADASQRDRDARNFQAWIKPSAARQKLIQRILQLDANFVFTFRAKERVKPTTGGKPVEMGFMPIAGDEFLFEMTVCCLLMPVAGGVPTWKSAMPGEAMMIKPAEQFKQLFDGYGLAREPLSEKHGEGLALWARGQTPTAEPKRDTAPPQEQRQVNPDWDHAAWRKTFGETLDELKTVADFTAVWSDESNQGLYQDLKARDLELAKSLNAQANGRLKALRAKETAAANADEF